MTKEWTKIIGPMDKQSIELASEMTKDYKEQLTAAQADLAVCKKAITYYLDGQPDDCISTTTGIMKRALERTGRGGE